MGLFRSLGHTVGTAFRGTRAVLRGTAHSSRWAGRKVLQVRQRGAGGEPGMTRLFDLHAASCAGDTLITIGLAGTIFFSAPLGEARTSVALYLLVTMVPFALLAPVVGPVLDHFRHGRRYALATTMLGRAFLAWLIADHLNGFGLYPAAFGVLALSRAYGVGRSADAVRPGQREHPERRRIQPETVQVIGDQPGQERPAEHGGGQRVPPAVPEMVEHRADHRGEQCERHHRHQQVERHTGACLAERRTEEDRAGEPDGDQGVSGAGRSVQIEQPGHARLAAGSALTHLQDLATRPAAAVCRAAQHRAGAAEGGPHGVPERAKQPHGPILAHPWWFRLGLWPKGGRGALVTGIGR